MKKFTFMLIAAFIAVASWAGAPVKKATALQPQSIVQLDAQKKAPKLTKAAAPFKVTAPATNRLAAKAKTNARRAPKMAGVTDLLTKEWMLCSEYYTYSQTEGLIPSTPAAGGTVISFSLIDATTIGIEGFVKGATEIVEATFTTEVDEELQADGVIAVATIADGQTLMESDYGPIILTNISGENEGDPMTAYVYNDGTVLIYDLWAGVIGGDGEAAGYLWTDYCYSMAMPVNGKMTWGEGDDAVEVPVFIFQDEETPKYVQVFNFADEETAVNVTMKTDQTFKIEEQEMFYYSSTYGYVYLTGLDGNYLATITGESEGNTLTFDTDWAFIIYSGSNIYLYGDTYTPATISYLDEEAEFITPVVADVAATPADPEILRINNYDSEVGYGSVAFVIPTTDAEDNDLMEDKLYYVLYSEIDGEAEVITFTPDLYEKLTEDMTEVPFTFTDNWDFADKGSYKLVFLNYNFNKMYDRVGVQSIYYGGGERNVSAIVWGDVEKEESGAGEFTFNFNEMDVPTSTNSTHDGDITTALELTEGSVTLTISPKVSGTENRFWATNDGPQLRVYSGTLTFDVPVGYTITNIVFNAPKWNEGNAADSGETEYDADTKVATWTGDAQNVEFTIAGNSQINSIVVTVEEAEISTDPVELPEGVEPEEYTLAASGIYPSIFGNMTLAIEETMNVAFDGNDVYLQGLSYWVPGAYVKGTLKNGQIVVKSGQYLGTDDYGYENFLIGLGVDEDGYFEYASEIAFDYDEETGVIELVEGTYYGDSETYDDEGLYDYYTAAMYIPGALEIPEAVVVPENLQAETWYLVAKGGTAARGEEVKVGVDGSDVYVQGLCRELPEAWVKGTIEDGVATFETGQYLGEYVDEEYGDTYNVFFLGYEYDEETDEETITDVEFAFDNEAGIMTTDQWLVFNTKQLVISALSYYYDVTITRDIPDLPKALEAPEDLVTEAYKFEGFDTYWEEDDEREIELGFYGENHDQVWIHGLSYYVPDAWVVGTLANGVLTIPETYLGIYTSYDMDMYFSGAEFVYDEETGTFTAEEGFTSYEDPDDQLWDEYIDVVLTKLNDFATTPADPTLDECDFEHSAGYNYINATIPTVDDEENELIASKLFYIIWIEKDGVEQPYTFSADLYSRDFEEDVTEVPFSHKGYDFFGSDNTVKVYFEDEIEELATWTKVGIQSVYYGGGERNASNIAWYDGEITTGINDINTANDTAVYFDLQGRKVNAAQKGLVIKQTRMENGTVKTQKVIRK